MTASTSKPRDLPALDALTGGAFTAATSGDRAARIREWLATDPSPEALQDVFRELSVKDKGAARPVRERLDEIRRAKGQEALAAEWAERALALLDAPRVNIADALAWQRDAAKAGAPLSREPLAALKQRLADRVRAIEDLQHQAMVQREASVLLAQRIEILSTKSWQEAVAAAASLTADVAHWDQQVDQLVAGEGWASVDVRFPPLVDSARSQLRVVWEAFRAALAQAEQASTDPAAALPPVPVWADEIRAARGEVVAPVPETRPTRPAIDPQVREAANTAVREAIAHLEKELAEGHGKASLSAANALRAALRDHGRAVDGKLDSQAQSALAAAGELEGWQRWRADQIRRELVAKAEALLRREDGADGTVVVPAMGGRKMQETLRQLREQWKAADHGGAGNHALWRRFDEACNAAHKVVEAWVDKLRAESAEHRAQRLGLIEEVKAWAAAQPSDGVDWKAFARTIHQFSERWRQAGHLGEKAFAEIQPQWKAAIHAAALPLEAAQKASIERRHGLIGEAQGLAQGGGLRMDAVRALQQRWQAEAQAVPLDRKLEQKLWDAFRKPIDEAFERRSSERERQTSLMSEHDRQVLEAARAVDQATGQGDAQAIRAALAALDAVMRAPNGGVTPPAPAPAASTPADGIEGSDAAGAGDEAGAPAPMAPRPAKPVVAMRGDDRPGQKRVEPQSAASRGRPGADRRAGPPARGEGFRDARGPRGAEFAPRGPRLGDAAFRAQRDAFEHAQSALRRLASQAHGEALTQLMAAWEKRDPEALPSAQELGRSLPTGARPAWIQALGAPAGADAAEALLRLEMAAEVPTPAEHLNARRALQLQLLTRRNSPSPAETWGQDVARVLAASHDAGAGRRLQAALKVLLRG